MGKKSVGQTIFFDNVYIDEGFALSGQKENEGKFQGKFDIVLENDKYKEKSFEKAERRMFSDALNGLLDKSKTTMSEIDTIIGGDLLNQIVSASFSCRNIEPSFIGLYNACATFAESLCVGSALIDSGLRDKVVCICGSHFSTAEKQYRFPLEYGFLRAPLSQWTATGVGSTLLTSNAVNAPKVVSATLGRVIDFGIKDANNMGAAMAPAAADTLTTFFKDTNTRPSDFDLILTGDLGVFGKTVFVELMKQQGYEFDDNYDDCGAMLFYKSQQVFQGGSGAACSALVFNAFVIDKLRKGKLKRFLMVGTGALLSPSTTFQGDSIPAIAHCVQCLGT